VVEHYEEVLAASIEVQAEISVKPTQLGLDIDEAAAYANLQRIALAAAKANSFLWIDMEGSAYTDRTIDLYRRLRLEAPHVGIALQAYLHRTVSDIAALIPLKPAIRLVKGAYAEPEQIAFGPKRDVDANYLALCVFMLPEVKRHKLRLVMATHDVELIARVWRFAQALDMVRSEFEVAMLYGIRTDEQLRLAREGYVVRDLIAYGDAWYAWYLRRLAERPANVWFVARQLLP
jgi:proline dehydrogenase